MLYTAEPYERTIKLLKSLCVVCTNSEPSIYNVSVYRSKDTVYSVQGCGREVFVVGEDVFELDCDDFHVGIRKEKQLRIKLNRFSTCSRTAYMQTEDADITWTEIHHIEFDMGSVELGDKKMGTLLVFDDLHASSAVSSVLRRFIKIELQQDGGDFERSLIKTLVSSGLV